MNAAELNAVDVEAPFAHSYPTLRPHLVRIVQGLRDDLIALPSDSDEDVILQQFATRIEELNVLDENAGDQHAGVEDIDTLEREALCDALYALGGAVGLDESTDYVDDYRDW
ncbi:hypothetical protein [Alienimonas chondri]|uniref:Uncharacterized protein n=1 Tax=Alienimonas chondri TaxID=2681879 RepID=A0ABX1VET4_9PLAN|nr:hypothetical protein [Alienimonas chondri]NNJ26501.1 hypothetical protein [Alienimonas chondri]